jgi:hypothetical protein
MLLMVVPLLFSCLPKKPEIPGTEVPAGPIAQALEQQRRSFTALKAVASIEVVRQGKRRMFETVGIVLDAQRRFRVEAVGPLGLPIIALVWDGKEIVLRLPDDRIMKPGQAGIERILGLGVDGRELCAVLSGTVTEIDMPSAARAYCSQDGVCIIELPAGDFVRRVHVLFSAGPTPAVLITAQELYRSDRLIYRARYERAEGMAAGPLPGTIVIENPEKKVTLTVEYAEADVNVPVADDAFTLDQEVSP